MPPRLQVLSRASRATSQAAYQPLAPFLYPFLGQQRAASILSSLSESKGHYNKRIRVGRGASSGYGKTSGRGHKGQKQHGKVPVGFNGGQTKDEVVSGIRGEVNHFASELSSVNLNRIQHWINNGRLNPNEPITLKELSSSRCIHGVKPDGVKLLARGADELTTPINIVVSRASAAAIASVEKLGGTVTTRYYTPFAVQQIRKGNMDPIHSLQSRITMAPSDEGGALAAAEALVEERKRFKYRLPDPASRKDLEYYRDSAHRGYLSHTVQEGHGPSLFFRTPGVAAKGRKKVVKKTKAGAAGGSENRLW